MAEHNLLPRIRACLFDMDGLLLDSEDKYTECTNEVLSRHSRPPLPWSVKARLQGRPGPESAALFQAWARLPISHEEFMAEQWEAQKRSFPSCRPLPGAVEVLERLAGRRITGERSVGGRDGGGKRGMEKEEEEEEEEGKEERAPPVYLALATSSRRDTYRLKTDHLADMFGLFEERCKVLGDDERIGKGRGKPCPDIYLLALETINQGIRERRGRGGPGQKEREVSAEECLVFEDSVPGVEAGRRAGMQVVWVPHPGLWEEFKGREEEVLAGCSGMEHERLREHGEGETAKAPGKVGDGWGRRIGSLEEFDYAWYGIDA